MSSGRNNNKISAWFKVLGSLNREPFEPCPSFHIAGLAILGASLAFLPPELVMCAHFDAPKRLIVSLVISVLLLAALRRGAGTADLRVPALAALLLGWFALRRAMLPDPWVETGVFVSWATPLLALSAGFLLGEKLLRALAPWILGAVLLQAGIMILQRVGWFNSLTWFIEQPSARMIGTIGYHNQAADFLALGIAVTSIVCRSRWWMLLSLPLLAVIYMTGCRGASVGATAALGCATLVTMRRSLPARRQVLAGLALVFGALVLLLLIPTLRDRLLLLRNPLEPKAGLSSRVWMARIASDMWQARPVTGWGPGAYASQYVERLGNVLPGEKTHPILQSVVFAREAHNDYLQFLAEFGLIGGLLAACLLWLVVEALRRGQECEIRRTGLFLLVFMAVQSGVSFVWQTALPGPLAGLLLGASVGSIRPREAGQPGGETTGPAARTLGIAMLTVGLLFNVFHLVDLYALRAVSVVESSADARRTCCRMPPWGFPYYSLLGAHCVRGGDTRAGLSMLEHASQGFMDIPLLNNLGCAYAATGNWSGALETYSLWARSGLDYQNARCNMSIALENLGRHAKAAESLAVVEELWPHCDLARGMRLAGLFLKTNQPKRAEKVLLGYMDKRGSCPKEKQVRLLNLLAAVHIMQNRPIQAAQALREVIAMDPQNEAARANLHLLETQHPK